MYQVRGLSSALVAACWTLVAAGCASFTGYPDDPVPPKSDLPALTEYFDPQKIVDYNSSADPLSRRRLRDTVVWGRIGAYDIMFREFKKKLTAEANGTNVGTDLTVLILNGIGATTGTKPQKQRLPQCQAALLVPKVSSARICSTRKPYRVSLPRWTPVVPKCLHVSW